VYNTVNIVDGRVEVVALIRTSRRVPRVDEIWLEEVREWGVGLRVSGEVDVGTDERSDFRFRSTRIRSVGKERTENSAVYFA
jgi:hypothetical protein